MNRKIRLQAKPLKKDLNFKGLTLDIIHYIAGPPSGIMLGCFGLVNREINPVLLLNRVKVNCYWQQLTAFEMDSKINVNLPFMGTRDLIIAFRLGLECFLFCLFLCLMYSYIF